MGLSKKDRELIVEIFNRIPKHKWQYYPLKEFKHTLDQFASNGADTIYTCSCGDKGTCKGCVRNGVNQDGEFKDGFNKEDCFCSSDRDDEPCDYCKRYYESDLFEQPLLKRLNTIKAEAMTAPPTKYKGGYLDGVNACIKVAYSITQPNPSNNPIIPVEDKANEPKEQEGEPCQYCDKICGQCQMHREIDKAIEEYLSQQPQESEKQPCQINYNINCKCSDCTPQQPQESECKHYNRSGVMGGQEKCMDCGEITREQPQESQESGEGEWTTKDGVDYPPQQPQTGRSAEEMLEEFTTEVFPIVPKCELHEAIIKAMHQFHKEQQGFNGNFDHKTIQRVRDSKSDAEARKILNSFINK